VMDRRFRRNLPPSYAINCPTADAHKGQWSTLSGPSGDTPWTSGPRPTDGWASQWIRSWDVSQNRSRRRWHPGRFPRMDNLGSLLRRWSMVAP